MKLSKLSIPYRTAKKLATIAAVAFFLTPGLTASPGSLIALSAGIILTSSLIAAYEYLYWRNYRFNISEDGINITSGVFSRNDKDIPLKRIQNVDLNRNILQRIVGIAKLDVETAGGSTTEASLKYLNQEEAETIRKQIRQLKNRREKEKNQEKEQKKEDFRLSSTELGLVSLTSVKMRSLAVIGFLLSLTGGFIDVLAQNTESSLAFMLILTSTILMIGLSGWAVSAARTFEKYFDFSIKFNENALEYERGMINRSSGTIPREKIQNLVVEENFLQRMLGYATLKIETAGNSFKQENKTGAETTIPLAKKPEVMAFAETIEGVETPEIRQISNRAVKRYTRRYVLIAAATAALIIGLKLPLTLLAIPLLLALGSKKAAELKRRNIGYGFTDEHLFTRKGFWNRKTYILGYFRIQNLMNTETIFQRRWKLRTVEVDTAGSKISKPVITDLDRENAGEITEKLFKEFKESLRQPA